MPPVNVIDSEGAIFSLPSEQLDAALAQGYQQATPEQIDHYDKVKAAGGKLGASQAFLGTTANSLTLGAFDPLLEKFSPEKAAQLKIAQEANPGATTAGEVAGFAGTVANPFLKAVAKPIASGFSALAGEAPGVATTLATKTGEMATLGAAMGAPKAAAEAVTGNYEEAAETLLASGAYGGAFGFLLGAGQVAAQKAGPALTNLKDYIGSRTEEALKNQKVKSLGAIQSDVAKLTPEKVDKIVSRAEEKGLFKIFQTKSSRAARVEALAEEAGNQKTAAIQEMSDAGIVVDNTPVLNRAYEIYTNKGQYENLGKAYREAAEGMSEDILNLENTPKAFDDYKMTLGPEGWDGFGRPVDTPKGYVAREMYDALKGEIVSAAEKAAETSPLAEKFVNASRDYDIFGDLERWATRALNRGANQGIKLSDMGAAALGGQIGGAAGMLKGFILNNARHEFGNMAMVKTLQGTLKAGQTVSSFIKEWGPKVLNPRVTQAAKIGAINAVRELTGEKDDNKATEKVVNNLSQFSSNPDLAADILSQSVPELSQADPRVTAALHQKAILMSQALLAVAPKKTIATSPFETDPGYTTGQIRDFNKKIAVAMNPLSAMKDLAAGRLDPDSIKLIQKIYPNLFAQMQRAVIDDATEKKRNYTYGQKLNLSLFLGAPVDSIGTPKNIQAFQDNYAKKDKTPNKSRRNPKSAANAKTEAQRIESR